MAATFGDFLVWGWPSLFGTLVEIIEIEPVELPGTGKPVEVGLCQPGTVDAATYTPLSGRSPAQYANSELK